MDKVDDTFNCLEGKRWSVWTMMEKLKCLQVFWKLLFWKSRQHCASEDQETLFNYEAVSKEHSYSLCSHGFLVIISLI